MTYEFDTETAFSELLREMEEKYDLERSEHVREVGKAVAHLQD